ncbi:MAG: CesT family type III secretion system chaperone [Pseudomonadota bacterium]
MTKVRHAGLSDYLLRSRIDPGEPRPDGSIVLVFDANMRVLLNPAPRGDLVLEAQVAELPASRNTSDQMLDAALAAAGRRPAYEADCLALASGGKRLVLQQRVAAEASSEEFERGLGRFLDALGAWRAQLGTL